MIGSNWTLGQGPWALAHGPWPMGLGPCALAHGHVGWLEINDSLFSGLWPLAGWRLIINYFGDFWVAGGLEGIM